MSNKAREEEKGSPTIHIIGKLADLMLGKLFMTKYVDLGIQVVKVHINNASIHNTLIELGDTINIMTRETMKKLQLTNMRPTPTILQPVDRSTIKPKVIVDDIIVSIDS
jgi:hypothetical protein